MSKSLIHLCLAALLMAWAVGEASAQTSRRSQRGQSHFGAEVPVRKAAEIPPDVLSILREDQRNRTCLRAGESPTKISRSWFVGSPIHLKSDGDADLLVTASDACLLGANIVPFWVFRNTPQGHKLILRVSALGLDVLNTRTNNYRDIRTGAATARTVRTLIFKFDREKYRPQTISKK